VVRGVRLIDDRMYQQTLQQADQILVDVQAQKLASLSDTSPLGFDQRLEAVGRGCWLSRCRPPVQVDAE
jgi:hypothetical protein